MLLACALACPAWAGANDTTLSERVGLDGRAVQSGSSWRVTQEIAEPLAVSGPVATRDALRGERADQVRQTMLWREHAASGLGFGIGVEQRVVNGPYSAQGLQQLHQPDQNAGALVGVSLATSERSRLTIQTPLGNAVSSPAGMAGSPGQQALGQDEFGKRQVSVGMVFNSKKPLSDLRQGFRTELSGQTTLAVKLRGGRLGFNVSKRW